MKFCKFSNFLLYYFLLINNPLLNNGLNDGLLKTLHIQVVVRHCESLHKFKSKTNNWNFLKFILFQFYLRITHYQIFK